jgi:photosystem II stability/assembly factor-like uncharacterized protein
MVTKAAITAQSGSSGNMPSGSWPAYALVLIVLAAAFYAFSPRPEPPFPPTLVHSDRLLINGLAQRGTRVIAVGEQGQIILADAPNGPWHAGKVQPQRGSTLTQVIFTGENTAIAVGHDGWVLRSEDNGESWTETAFDAERSDPLLGVAGPYAGKIFAFGGFGRFMVSGDGGKTWTKETSAAIGDHHVNAMTRTGDGSLLLVGERGLMLRSADNGKSWQTLPSIYTGSFYGVLTLPSKRLLVYGMRGNAFSSGDNGHTWQKSTVPLEVSLLGGASTKGEVVLVGEGNSILVSQDGGQHFRVAAEGERRSLAAVIPIAAGEWLTGGESGVALKKAVAGAKS